ncbi:MAG TPA: YfaZ family outer membrane protein [Geminicoccaceae bacterium]
MNVISRAVLTAVATAGVALPATAQQGALSGFPSFDSVDANLDGTIAREEFRRALSEVEQPDQLFAEADADGDGQISRREWSDWQRQRMAGAGAAAEPEAETGREERPNRIEVALTEEVLQGKYIRDADLVGLPGNTLAFGILFSDDRDIVGTTELLAPGLIDQWLPPFISLSLGGKAYLGLLDDPSDDVFALAPGAEVRVDIPLDVPMAGVGRIFYAPDIATFGDSDEVFEFDVRAEVRFLPQTTGFVGYRLLNFEREDGGDDKIVNGIHAGIRFAF